jgi:hypothetical protein
VGFVSKLSYHAKAKGMRERERERERERGEATWKSYSTEWRKDSPYDLVARADQTVLVDRYMDE